MPRRAIVEETGQAAQPFSAYREGGVALQAGPSLGWRRAVPDVYTPPPN